MMDEFEMGSTPESSMSSNKTTMTHSQSGSGNHSRGGDDSTMDTTGVGGSHDDDGHENDKEVFEHFVFV